MRPWPTYAAGGFRRLLISLYLAGDMSAKRIVRIAHLATKSGATGCEDFARNIKHDRNCARLMRTALKYKQVQAEFLHATCMPVNNGRRASVRRAVRQDVSTIPVFEVFSRQFSKEPGTFLKHRADPDLLCDNFHSHELVTQHGGDYGIPCRLFADFAVLDREA